ncbi:hypothetical protein Bbelb_248520 [Branchiostoma belcheri]|nr:hypothetical protein Bbelb_248520 [Branchiostoma belcheri]
MSPIDRRAWLFGGDLRGVTAAKRHQTFLRVGPYVYVCVYLPPLPLVCGAATLCENPPTGSWLNLQQRTYREALRSRGAVYIRRVGRLLQRNLSVIATACQSVEECTLEAACCTEALSY